MKVKKATIVVVLILMVVSFYAGHIFHSQSLSGHSELHKNNDAETGVAEEESIQEWTCSMHPQIRRPKPGKCPICAMDLIPVKSGLQSSDEHAPVLELSPSAEKLADITTLPVERKFVSVEIKMFGKVAFNESTLSFITARMPGRIDKLYVNYAGIAVKKGEHIAEVYSPDLLLAQRELIESLKLLKTSKPDDEFAGRIMNSVREKYRLWGFSEEQVQEIIDKGKISDHLTITAPISGIVIEKDVNEGKYYEKGERLFTIADLNQVWVNLEAYETELPFIKYGQEVEFTTEAFPERTFTGRIAFIQPFMNEMTRTVKVRLNADNHHGALKPGMFVHALLRAKIAENEKVIEPYLAGKWISPMHPEIIKDGPGKCDICGMDLVPAETLGFTDENDKKFLPPLVVPVSAPLITGKRAVVYLAVSGRKGVYEGREIRLGSRAGDYYIVKAGLKEGENVVVKGNFKIDSSLQIMAKPSMMTAPENKNSEPKVKKKDNAHNHAAILPDELLDSYFAVQKALSLDNLADAAGHAAVLDKHYSAALSSSKDLKSAREVFVVISNRLYEDIAGAGEKIRRPVYRFFCPMAFESRGAYWLQDNDKIQNPYFGSVMFGCGELKETISDAK